MKRRNSPARKTLQMLVEGSPLCCACCVRAAFKRLKMPPHHIREQRRGCVPSLASCGWRTSPRSVRKVVSYSLKRLVASEDELSGQMEQFEALRAATQANFRDSNFSAGALARQFGVSQSWITRLSSRNTTAARFLEYVHGIRLNAAERLLADPSLTEAEIAGRVGYNNTVTMIGAFKKYRGVVPMPVAPGEVMVCGMGL